MFGEHCWHDPWDGLAIGGFAAARVRFTTDGEANPRMDARQNTGAISHLGMTSQSDLSGISLVNIRSEARFVSPTQERNPACMRGRSGRWLV